MRSLIFVTLFAVAFGLPSSEVPESLPASQVPEIELSQAMLESAAHEAIREMKGGGNSDTACRNMATAAGKAIESAIDADQNMLDALPTGSDCDKHVGESNGAIKAARKALADAKISAQKAAEAADKAATAPVNVGKIPLNQLGKGKCTAVFGAAYKAAQRGKKAADSAKAAADAEVVAFKKALAAAEKAGAKAKNDCLCKAQKANSAALDALSKKDRKKMETDYKKAKMMLCVLDGVNTSNKKCAPPLKNLSNPSLNNEVCSAKCASASSKRLVCGSTQKRRL